MVSLMNKGREDILSGRSSVMNSFRTVDVSIMEDNLPPLAIFRSEMKRCCESLNVALENYLVPDDDQSIEVWRKIQRLKNVCYDLGFPRGEDYPCHTLSANWNPVYASTSTEYTRSKDSGEAFWTGGQVTKEGLKWLLDNSLPGAVDPGTSNGSALVNYPSGEAQITIGGNRNLMNGSTSSSFKTIVNKSSDGEIYPMINTNVSITMRNDGNHVMTQKVGDSVSETRLTLGEDDLGPIEGNMCASSTGVVRVQSRKKAEMFLVRTDGYSCTREKVTESSLAFTHPSAQQQMLVWIFTLPKLNAIVSLLICIFEAQRSLHT